MAERSKEEGRVNCMIAVLFKLKKEVRDVSRAGLQLRFEDESSEGTQRGGVVGCFLVMMRLHKRVESSYYILF